MLLWVLVWLCWPAARRCIRESEAAWWGLVLAISAGLLLHLLMDYLNPFGLHPFHPFDSRWYFGDLVFILEPVFWVTFCIPLAMMMPWRLPRILGVAALLGVPLYFTARAFLPWFLFAALAAIALVLTISQWRSGARRCQPQARPLVPSFGYIDVFIPEQSLVLGVCHGRGQ